ncbi:hypothetical protein CEXT_605161, partial [Caerostris extrusa]
TSDRTPDGSYVLYGVSSCFRLLQSIWFLGMPRSPERLSRDYGLNVCCRQVETLKLKAWTTS